MDRRSVLGSMVAGMGVMAAAPAWAQGAAAPGDVPHWSAPVIDMHFHMRRDPAANVAHQQGAGVTAACLLTRTGAEEEIHALQAANPGMFPCYMVGYDVTKPDAEQVLTAAVKAGARGIGELKYHVAADGPEMRRIYDLCAEMGVPVMMHIQSFPHFAGELPYNTGYPQFDKMLQAHPKTKFIGHGDLFWAHISADVPTDRGYPSGPIKPGGLTDRFLSDYSNLYADISANSGNNALARDVDFSREFIVRHRAKLIFGSDCGCMDGKGSGISQGRNPEAARLAGQCVARATLGLLKRTTSPEIFRQITWNNGQRMFQVNV